MLLHLWANVVIVCGLPTPIFVTLPILRRFMAKASWSPCSWQRHSPRASGTFTSRRTSSAPWNTDATTTAITASIEEAAEETASTEIQWKNKLNEQRESARCLLNLQIYQSSSTEQWWFRSLGIITALKQSSRGEKAIPGATLGIPGISGATLGIASHDLSHAKPNSRSNSRSDSRDWREAPRRVSS